MRVSRVRLTARTSSYQRELLVHRCLRRGWRGVLCPVAQERLRGGGVARTGEEKALSAVAVLVSEQGELLLLLDALGEGLDRERLAELHEGVDERLALLVVPQPEMNDRSIFSASTGNRWR